jgi:hypothetical protein
MRRKMDIAMKEEREERKLNRRDEEEKIYWNEGRKGRGEDEKGVTREEERIFEKDEEGERKKAWEEERWVHNRAAGRHPSPSTHT